MNNKKHIDRLFQEKLKDFEAQPKPEVWEAIQKKIAKPEEDRKRIIPIWYKYAGIAATLLLFFTLGTLYYNSTSTNTIVDVELKDVQLKNNTQEETINAKVSNNNNDLNDVDALLEKDSTVVVSSSQTTSNSDSNSIKKSDNKTNTVTNSTSYKKNTTSASDYISTQTNTSLSNNKSSLKRTANQDYIVSTPKYSNPIETQNKPYKNNTASQDYITSTPKYSNPIETQKNSIHNNPTTTDAITVISNSNIQKIPTTVNGKNKDEEIKAAIDAVKKESISTANVESSDKKEIVTDSISTNAIEKAIADAENKSETDNKKQEKDSLNRWSVNANAAPVYYNTLTKGSHIDGQFIDNTKNGVVNASYGVNVGYAINNKLKIRSGINTLNLGYETTNVIVYENVENSGRGPNTIKNLNVASINENGEGLSVISAEKINENQVSSFLSQNFNTTNLKQQINYIEVPVELEYAVLNNRIGINLIGGMSTFILGGNEISSDLKGVATQIGEANNINSISFSTNLGLGMDYDFSKALTLNLEPTFKYQINAFNNTSGNFKPYLLGIYTGLSYKF